MNHNQPQRALVRFPFAEDAIWRPALGQFEPLLAAATFGPIDAPENLPAGAMRASVRGPIPIISNRS